MNIGLSASSFPANMTIPQCLRLVRRAAFDCVELDISEAGYLTLDSDAKAVSFLRQAVENISLYVGCARADVIPGVPVSDYGRVLEECISICAGLGCNRLAVPLGAAGDIEAALAGLTHVLRGIGKMAMEAGVSVALECGAGELLSSPQSMQSYVDSIECPCIGVCVDSGCTSDCDSPHEWIMTLGGRVKMVRARDFRVFPGGQLEYVNLLEGDIDWKLVRKALVEVGYDAAVVASAPGYRQYPELGIKHCGDKMKRIFGSANGTVE